MISYASSHIVDVGRLREPVYITDDLYQKIREQFIVHVKNTTGPHKINTEMIDRLFHKIDPSGIAMSFDKTFQRLVAEFCPIQFLVDKTFDPVAAIAQVDASTDYIYALGTNLINRDERVFSISNELIAVALKLAY